MLMFTVGLMMTSRSFTRQRVSPAMLPRLGDEADCLFDLLLQRAVQTCCFTARSCRDPPTATWLARSANSEIRQPEDFERMHAVGILRTPWRTYLSKMLAAPPQEIQVESLLKTNRGASPNNPFLRQERMTYSYELVPQQIAERVMQAAQQIAEEWAEEALPCMAAENEKVWRDRRATVTRDDEEVRTTMPAFQQDQDGSGAGDGSPFKGGNYDLLLFVATRRAAHSTLAELAKQPLKSGEHALLAEQMSKLPRDGLELGHGAADTWLTELLELPVVLRMDDVSAASGTLVDPRAVAEVVLNHRLSVAKDWQRILRGASEMFLDVKRNYLAERAGESLTADSGEEPL